MAKKKTIKDVEAEEKLKISEELEEVEEIDEIEEEIDEEEIDEEEIEEIEESEDEDEIEDEEEDDEEEDDDEEIKEDKKKAKKEDKKKEKEKKKSKNKKDGYFTQVGRELNKVVWPKAGEVAKYSFAVIMFCVVLALFFVGIDALASFIKSIIEGL